MKASNMGQDSRMLAEAYQKPISRSMKTIKIEVN